MTIKQAGSKEMANHGNNDSHSDKGLWLDPFEEDSALKNRMNIGAVLLAEDIKRYIEHNLLINRIDYLEGQQLGAKLKGASYMMTPDPEGGWMVDEDEKLVKLKTEEDPDGKYFVVPKNTFVFIRLKQQLRLPYYMIGRINLNIIYVYQGLLLGTGPQVDPGFVETLHIPLHNFTTKDVHVYHNAAFVSIDFVRTSTLHFDKGIPDSIEDFYQTYEHDKCLFDRKKLKERTRLTDYLKGRRPQSAMIEFLRKYEKIDHQIKVFQIWNAVESFAVASMLVASVIALISWVRDADDEIRTKIPNIADISLLRDDVQTKLTTYINAQQPTHATLQAGISNSVLTFAEYQKLVTSNHAELVLRIIALEAQASNRTSQTLTGSGTNTVATAIFNNNRR